MSGASWDYSTFNQVGGDQYNIFLPPLSPRTLLCTLPADTSAFTDREDQIDEITAAAVATSAPGPVAGIHAINGMAGVGKTALAVHVAHLLRGRFSGRQLFIDLHAHTPGQDPVLPEAALAGLLAAVGVDVRYLPEAMEDRAGLWRDRMVGQRALLVLDNAASSAQVAPLLPGGGDCLVLITSRRHLGDLPGGVVPVLLDALPPDQAQEMFMRLAPRAAAQPGAVAELAGLAGLAGYLPLAISLLARVYARHPSWTLADLTGETQASLLTLVAEKDSVAAAFDVSYRYLHAIQQQFFRCLGLHPGTTTDAYAAAALAGVPLRDAADSLDVLHGEGLLTEVGYRRYGMHDLIRRYAQNLAATDPADLRDQALGRLLDYYLHTAVIAETFLARYACARPAPVLTAPPVAIPELPDYMRALAWARAERGNLVACLDHVTRTGQHARVVAMTAAIAALLRLDGPWADAVTRNRTAVQAARCLGDQVGHADALSNLGAVRRLSDDYPGAAEALEAALGIYRDLGDRLGEGEALGELGAVRRQTGDYRSAAEALEAARDICGDLGDRLGQANALTNLGAVRRRTGDSQGSAEALEAALGIYRELRDPMGQGNALTELGAVRQLTGDYRGAAEALEAALGIYRELRDPLGEANALTDLGVVREKSMDYRGAAEALEAALGIYRDLGDRLSEAGALGELGIVRRETQDYRGAAEALEAALSIFRDLGNRQGEAEALNDLGTLHRVRSDLDQAYACHRQALDLAREIESLWDEACALAGLSRCALAAGRTDDAQVGLRQALEVFHRTGAAEAISVATELAAITGIRPAL